MATPDRRRRVVYAAAIIVAAVEFYISVFVRVGDFGVHLEFGKDFIAGNPYIHGGAIYPLPRLMFDAGLFLFGFYTARVLSYAAALAALLYCIRAWNHMIEERFPLSPQAAFDVGTAAIVVIAPTMVRDLDECGLQIFLLLFLTLAAEARTAGKIVRSGFWLAVAACYKATPLLFLPFLLWKREWKAAGLMAGWIVVLNLLPVLWLGAEKTVVANVQLVERMEVVSRHAEAFPSLGAIEAPKHQNLSFYALIARFLETYPKGHPLNLDHPLFFQFGNFDASTAKIVVLAVTLLLGLAIAWRFRHKWGSPEAPTDLPSEWAVATLFSALLSPVCWQQHLVLGFPCLLIAIRSTFSARKISRGRIATLAMIAVIMLIARRTFFGRPTALVFMSYNHFTIAFLAAAALTIFLPRRPEAISDAAREPLQTDLAIASRTDAPTRRH